MSKKRGGLVFILLVIIILFSLVFFIGCSSGSGGTPNCLKYSCLKDTDGDGTDCRSEDNPSNKDESNSMSCEYSKKC